MSDTTLKMLLIAEDRNASKSIRDVGDAADDTDRRAGDLGDGLGEVGERMSAVMTKAGAAGPAVMAVGAAMSAAAAGGTALLGAIGPAAAAGIVTYAGVLMAVKQGAAVARLALDGVAEAAGGNEEAMKALTPEGRELAKTLADLQPEIKGVRTEAQAGMFPGIEDAVSRLAGSYFPLLQTAARETGTELGFLAQRGALMADTPAFRRDFAAITQANAGTIARLGSAGLNLADTARILLVTGLPVIDMFTRWANGASETILQATKAGRASGDLAAFWENAADTGAQLGRILGDLAVGLYNVFKIGAAGEGAGMLDTVETLTQRFRDWTGSANGAKAIADWFATGRDNLAAMSGLVGDVFAGMSEIGSGAALAPLIEQIRSEVIPPLMEFLENASAAGALGALVSAVGRVISVFAELSASDGSLKSFAATLDAVATAALWIVQNVPGASTVLAAFFTVVGANAALKLVGLGPAVSALGAGITALTTRFLISTGVMAVDTTATAVNTAAKTTARGAILAWLGAKALEAAAWLRSAAFAAAATAGVIAHEVAMRVAAVATKVWAAGQWLLNAALTANPIGLVIVAIAALVAGLIFAYRNSETFRKIVDGAFKAVAAGGKWLWENALKPAFAGIKAGFEALGRAGVWLWNNALQPAFKLIVTGVAGILTMWAKMLGVLAKVPGFGWAKKASEAMYDAAAKANKLADGIKQIPPQKSFVIRGNPDPAMAAIARVNYARIKDKSFTITTYYDAVRRDSNTANFAPPPGSSRAGRAVGGPVFRGVAYEVGEQGRELFVPGQDGQILTAAETNRLTKGSGGRAYDDGSGFLGTVEVIVRHEDGREIQRKLLRTKRELGGRGLGFDD